MPTYPILISTHASQIHLIHFTPSPAPSLSLITTLELSPQPSYIERSPSHPELFYVNSWVEDKLFVVRLRGEKLEVVQEMKSVGGGPTFIKVTKDGKGLLVICYRSGTLTLHPLLPTGLLSPPLPHHTHTFPPSSRPSAALGAGRQESPHPHHIIPVGAAGDEYLIPDLGSDVVWNMKWTEEGWVVLGGMEGERGWGCRHGVVSDDGSTLYLLSELSSHLSIHSLLRASPHTPSAAISTHPLLPPNLRTLPKSSYNPYALIACAIELLPPLQEGGEGMLITTNRDAPPEEAPEGDTFTIFSIPSDDPRTVSEPTFVTGAGTHLRGLAVGPVGERRGRWVLIMGRDGGGLSVYERAKGGLKLVVEGQLRELGKPVGGLWI